MPAASIVAAVGAAALTVTMSPVPAPAQEAVIGLPIGAVPDAVKLENLGGSEVDLADYIGDGPALIQFWALWCENCEALRPQLEAAHERYGDRVQFLAVAVAVGQSRRAIRRHLKKTPLAYAALWDGEGRAVRSFKAPVTSYIVILDAEGRVAYTGVGPAQDIEAAIRGVLGE